MSEATQERPDAGALCPRCRVDLLMSERQGIEIDYCPRCRGVWLDRGELDKIIERDEATRAAPVAAQPTPQPPSAPGASPWAAGAPPYAPPPQAWGGHDPYGHGRGGSSHGGHDRGRGHRSFLGRLFD